MNDQIRTIAHQWLSHLQKEREDTAPSKIPVFGNLTIEQATGKLYACYADEVHQRGRRMELDNFSTDKIEKIGGWIAGFEKSPKCGLLLYGKTGTGKTMMLRALKSMITIRVCSVLTTASEVTKQFADDCNGKNTDYRVMRSCDVLMIDDLGCEPLKFINYGMEMTPVLDLLYYRYDRQRLTIITSNLEDEELRQRYGERLADRMEESYDRLYYDSPESYRRK